MQRLRQNHTMQKNQAKNAASLLEKRAAEIASQLAEKAEFLHYQKTNWVGYKYFDHAFDYEHIDDFFEEILSTLEFEESIGYPLIKKSKKKEYLNIPASFDIETSSFYDLRNKKAAIMYIWQFGFNGSVIYGRTWDEWFDFLERLAQELSLDEDFILPIYVHNLTYEFQWIRKYFEWDKIFALKKRKVLYCQYLPLGLEFRCSYLLANASLAHVGDKLLQKYKVKKMVGDLDYSKIRHSRTPLTQEELQYCLNDVRVVMAFIQEKIEHDGGINNIPLTNTGYVRNFSRSECMSDKYSSQKYHALMRCLSIDSEEEYDQNKRAFMGGFTHTGILHANKIREGVGSADLISSYPAEIVGSYMPMSSAKFIGTPTSQLAFENALNTYCCIFDVKFTNLRPLVEYEHYLSISRCICTNPTSNNGRIVSADECLTTLTELDFDIVNKLYDWDSMEVTNLRCYTRGYLPKSIIMAVLKLYASKTRLKDIPEEVVEYMRSKNMVNASFGMMVTDIIRPGYFIDEDDMWREEQAYKAKQLNDYNKNFNRFLYYTWGVYVTAHARHNLFEAIMEFGNDYVYADTDSIKGINFEKHLDFFESYNYKNKLRMQKMCRAMDIDCSLVCPKTIKGEEKLLGNWEVERGYAYFKACGAKRYMYIFDDGTLSFTIAGLNKKFAIPYLLDAYRGDKMAILRNFQDGFTVPPGFTGKQTLTYLDEPVEGYIYDYLGNRCDYCEASAIHMEPQGFSMSQTDEYLRLLSGIEESELR